MGKDQEIAMLKKELSKLADEIDKISRQLGWIAEAIMRSQEKKA